MYCNPLDRLLETAADFVDLRICQAIEKWQRQRAIRHILGDA